MTNHNKNFCYDRTFYYDNAKFLLILLVVTAHFFSPSREGNLTHNIFCNSICTTIHLFVMPTFFIISGYFSPTEVDRKWAHKIFTYIFIPLVVFEIIFFFSVPKKMHLSNLFIEPFYTLWFLGLLFLYRIFSPFIFYIGVSFFFFSSLILGFLSHLEIPSISWGYYDLVKYAPYFLIGMWLQKKQLNIAALNFSLTFKIASILLFIGCFYTLHMLEVSFLEVLPDNSDSGKTTGVLLLIKKYSAFGSFARDIVYRIIGIALAISFFILVPKNYTWFSKYGNNSLYPFLLHPFIMHFMEKNLFFYQNTDWVFLLSLWIICLIVTITLSIDFIAKNFSNLFEFLSKTFSASNK